MSRFLSGFALVGALVLVLVHPRPCPPTPVAQAPSATTWTS